MPDPPSSGRKGSSGLVFGSRSVCLLAAAVASACAGCGPRTTEFHVTDHRPDQPPEHYFETFDECYYCLDAQGHADIVARRHPPRRIAAEGGPDPATQVVHIRQVWLAVPGRTFAEASMINATVSYLIVGPSGGAAFDGGGFCTFTENRKGTEIRGRLESSTLRARHGVDTGNELFGRASVTGTFRAQRNERQVRRIMHEMERLFGPMPPYQPPPTDPDLR